jgi:hypothetical protein
LFFGGVAICFLARMSVKDGIASALASLGLAMTLVRKRKQDTLVSCFLLEVSHGCVGRDVIPPIYGSAGCHIVPEGYPAPHHLFVLTKPCEGYMCDKIMDANKDFDWKIYMATAKPSQG